MSSSWKLFLASGVTFVSAVTFLPGQVSKTTDQRVHQEEDTNHADTEGCQCLLIRVDGKSRDFSVTKDAD